MKSGSGSSGSKKSTANNTQPQSRKKRQNVNRHQQNESAPQTRQAPDVSTSNTLGNRQATTVGVPSAHTSRKDEGSKKTTDPQKQPQKGEPRPSTHGKHIPLVTVSQPIKRRRAGTEAGSSDSDNKTNDSNQAGRLVKGRSSIKGANPIVSLSKEPSKQTTTRKNSTTMSKPKKSAGGGNDQVRIDCSALAAKAETDEAAYQKLKSIIMRDLFRPLDDDDDDDEDEDEDDEDEDDEDEDDEDEDDEDEDDDDPFHDYSDDDDEAEMIERLLSTGEEGDPTYDALMDALLTGSFDDESAFMSDDYDDGWGAADMSDDDDDDVDTYDMTDTTQQLDSVEKILAQKSLASYRPPTNADNNTATIKKNPYLVHVTRKDDIQNSRLQLPVCAQEREIMEVIHENNVVILSGETGSGKTTQVPQFLYEAGYCRDGMVGITQPRRVAAISAANRVRVELNEGPDVVGHQIRFEHSIKPTTKIKMMTEGILLREIQSDFLLSKYSCIIVDEAHERGLNTDILLGLLSRIVTLRAQIIQHQQGAAFLSTTNIDHALLDTSTSSIDLAQYKFPIDGVSKGQLKVIIMSATLRVTDFTQNHRLFPIPPPVYTVDSRQYPVSTHFSRFTPIDYVEKALQKVCRVHTRLPAGAILVFLTGRDEIERFCKQLREIFPEPVPGEDNSINVNALGGGGRLYLKAFKIVQKALAEQAIEVKWDSKRFNDDQKGGAADGGNPDDHGNAEAGKSNGLTAEQRRWALFDQEIAAENEQAHKENSAKNKVNKKSNAKRMPEPPKRAITQQQFRRLVQKQVVLIKEIEKKNRDIRLADRNKKIAKGKAFTVEEVRREDQEHRQKQYEAGGAMAAAEQGGDQHAPLALLNTNVPINLMDAITALESSSTDTHGEDADDMDEELYELSDDDDYGDDENFDDDDEDSQGDASSKKNKKKKSGGSDDDTNNDDDESEDPDTSKSLLEKEQSSSNQHSAAKWQEELEYLKKSEQPPMLVLPLYAMLPTHEQMKVFQHAKYSHGSRVVVVSTNVAETSVTIPDVRYVVDTGREKTKNVDMKTGATHFSIGFIPKSSANQRSGRAGRTGPGHSYRLFSGAVFDEYFPLHSEPEILKQPFETTLLQMKSIGIHNIASFPFPTPPKQASLQYAAYILYVIGALITKKQHQENLLKAQQDKEHIAYISTGGSSSSSKSNATAQLLHQREQYQKEKANASSFLLEAPKASWEKLAEYRSELREKNQPVMVKGLDGTLQLNTMNKESTQHLTKYQRRQLRKQQAEEEERTRGEREARERIDKQTEELESASITVKRVAAQLNDLQITPIGTTMAYFPLHPRFAKVLLTCANQPKCLPLGIAITALMTVQELMVKPDFLVEHEKLAARRLASGKSIDDDSDDSDDNEDDPFGDDGRSSHDNGLARKLQQAKRKMKDDDDQESLSSALRDDIKSALDEKVEKAKQVETDKKQKSLEIKRLRRKILLQKVDQYKTTMAQWIVESSDLFTRLRIVGAYIYQRNSAIRKEWRALRKRGQAATGKAAETYQNLPYPSKRLVDRSLYQFCQHNFVRFKGMQEVVKIIEQLTRIVASHLKMKADVNEIRFGDIDNDENEENNDNDDPLSKKLESQESDNPRILGLLEEITSPNLPIPDEADFQALQQILVTSFPDRIAVLMSRERKLEMLGRSKQLNLKPQKRFFSYELRNQLQRALSPEDEQEMIANAPLSLRDLDNAYEIIDSDEPVFISQDSIVWGDTLPYMVIYNDVQEKVGRYHRTLISGITLVREAWVPTLATTLCSLHDPGEDSKPPFYSHEDQCMMRYMSVTYGPRAWQLPLHPVPYTEYDIEFYKHLTRLFISGAIFPFMKQFSPFYNTPIHACLERSLRQPALGVVMELQNKRVRNGEDMKQIWTGTDQRRKDLKWLLKEVAAWVTVPKYRSLLLSSWPPVKE